jgi:ABC-type transporter Mla MlaB component
MITSYVTPQRSLLYLSLVGPLNEYSADDLVNEYYERQADGMQQCILDLAAAESADDVGLTVLHRLSLLAQVDRIEFSLVVAGSPVEKRVSEVAAAYWVPIVDGSDVPFAQR